MKPFFSVWLTLLINASLVSMDLFPNKKIVQIQVGSDNPCPILLDTLEQCVLGQIALCSKTLMKIPKLKLLHGQELSTEDFLMVCKILQDPSSVSKISKQDIEQLFFTADFMGVPENLMFALAKRYKDLVGFKTLDKLDEYKKIEILKYLKSIKDVAHKVARCGAREIILPKQGIMFVHDIDLLGNKLNLENITDLCLSHNKLTKSYLKKIFTACPSVQGIDLSHNQIKKITKKEINMIPSKLCFLDLSHNNLTQFPIQRISLRSKFIHILLQENYLSHQEVARLEKIQKKSGGHKAFIALMFCVVQYFRTGDFLLQDSSFIWMQLVLLIVGLIDFMNASYQDLAQDGTIILTENQRIL